MQELEKKILETHLSSMADGRRILPGGSSWSSTRIGDAPGDLVQRGDWAPGWGEGRPIMGGSVGELLEALCFLFSPLCFSSGTREDTDFPLTLTVGRPEQPTRRVSKRMTQSAQSAPFDSTLFFEEDLNVKSIIRGFLVLMSLSQPMYSRLEFMGILKV
jgi:hypothetical protein